MSDEKGKKREDEGQAAKVRVRKPAKLIIRIRKVMDWSITLHYTSLHYTVCYNIHLTSLLLLFLTFMTHLVQMLQWCALTGLNPLHRLQYLRYLFAPLQCVQFSTVQSSRYVNGRLNRNGDCIPNMV